MRISGTLLLSVCMSLLAIPQAGAQIGKWSCSVASVDSMASVSLSALATTFEAKRIHTCITEDGVYLFWLLTDPIHVKPNLCGYRQIFVSTQKDLLTPQTKTVSPDDTWQAPLEAVDRFQVYSGVCPPPDDTTYITAHFLSPAEFERIDGAFKRLISSRELFDQSLRQSQIDPNDAVATGLISQIFSTDGAKSNSLVLFAIEKNQESAFNFWTEPVYSIQLGTKDEMYRVFAKLCDESLCIVSIYKVVV
jgi:hypothetical protein